MPKGVALVTGASYGLGSHIAKQLAAAKWEVVLVARSREKLREVQAEIAQENGISLVLEADITDKNAVANLMKKTSEAFPNGIDLLVNNAAYVAPVHKFVEADMSEWERMVAVNVWGALNMTRTFLPSMVEKKKGKVVFISSKAGVNPSPGLAVHSGTKHMVEAVAKGLRQELAGTGVTVGVIRPGGVNTPGYLHCTGSEESKAAMTSLGSWVPADTASCLQPEDVARVVVNMVDMMDRADVTDINIDSIKQIN
eukprot:GFUD01009941.1.p1 GENE.GFUD01009941.1~~GFUD01009941.1.p1  ORF type:complete len:254 (-),score=105.17 GFUD01009941.1:14-775(-)